LYHKGRLERADTHAKQRKNALDELRDEPSGKIAVNNVLSAFISFALVVSVSPSYAQQLKDGDVLARSHATVAQKLAQLRGFSAAGTHQCASDKSRNCVVAGSGFSNCNDASTILQTRDCCPTTPAGGKSIGFTLNYCIPDR
jgi:hypothetical protein